MVSLLEYIDWYGIVEDHKLKSGDISPEQSEQLDVIIKEFINQNK